MKLNEYRLAMVVRWRKLYGFRNRTRLTRSDRAEAMLALHEYLNTKGEHNG